jgi:phosphopantothenoylcysteine synthetase/decarboxylase
MKRVLVTSGPTRAYFDRVRYIANTSTGALGARIVEVLLSRGIPVIHVYGSGSENPAAGNTHLLESIEVVTIDDLIHTLRTAAKDRDIAAVVHAMAVLDYMPESTLDGKKSSGDDFWDVRLVKTPKVIGLIRELMPDAVIAGFKLESCVSEHVLIERAGALLDRYNLDIVVANMQEHVGMEHHEALFIGPGKKILAAASTKRDIAAKLADFIEEKI